MTRERRHVPDEILGRVSTLRVRRVIPSGVLLARPEDDDRDAVLLPRREGTGVDPAEGEDVEVFVYLDSEDAPIATRKRPLVVRDEVTFLPVTDVTNFGAFVDWGLPKELLVPLDEQIRDVHVGDRHPIGVYVDDSGRLAGTMRVSEMLRGAHDFRVDQWLDGEAWRKEPGLGVFVILERRVVGLLPETEPHNLLRGEAARFRVAHVHRDGKIELTLREHAHKERDNDAKKILEVLAKSPTPVTESATPEEIRNRFGLSKKAFKRAVGGLLKEGAIEFAPDGSIVRRGS
jgi:uncharacterized protein